MMIPDYSNLSKIELHQQILTTMTTLWSIAVKAAVDAKNHATHSESIAEHQYDTLGLEASYLAEGQSKRAKDLEQDIDLFKAMPLLSFDENSPINLSALIQLEPISTTTTDSVWRNLFLSPVSGGLNITHQGMDIMLITPLAPIGKQLIGAYVGDEIHVPVKDQMIRCEITDVL